MVQHVLRRTWHERRDISSLMTSLENIVKKDKKIVLKNWSHE